MRGEAGDAVGQCAIVAVGNIPPVRGRCVVDRRVEGGEVYSTAVRVEVPASRIRGGHDIRFTLSDADSPSRRVREKARFIAPP